MAKVGELKTKETHFVIYRNAKAKCNPFKIYRVWYEKEKKHKELLESYEDLYSCVLYIKDYVKTNYQ